jgi:hypothetical protein
LRNGSGSRGGAVYYEGGAGSDSDEGSTALVLPPRGGDVTPPGISEEDIKLAILEGRAGPDLVRVAKHMRARSASIASSLGPPSPGHSGGSTYQVIEDRDRSGGSGGLSVGEWTHSPASAPAGRQKWKYFGARLAVQVYECSGLPALDMASRATNASVVCLLVDGRGRVRDSQETEVIEGTVDPRWDPGECWRDWKGLEEVESDWRVVVEVWHHGKMAKELLGVVSWKMDELEEKNGEMVYGWMSLEPTEAVGGVDGGRDPGAFLSFLDFWNYFIFSSKKAQFKFRLNFLSTVERLWE